MRSLLLILTSLSPLLTAATLSQCLENTDAEQIVNRWVRLWRSLPTDEEINGIVTPNFTFYEGDSTLDDAKTAVASAKDFKDYIFKDSFDPQTLDSVTTNEEVEYWFASCDRVAIRWKATGVTTGINQAKTGIAKGVKVAYKGIDLLHVDVASKRARQAETSQDFVHYYDQVGYSVQPKQNEQALKALRKRSGVSLAMNRFGTAIGITRRKVGFYT